MEQTQALTRSDHAQVARRPAPTRTLPAQRHEAPEINVHGVERVASGVAGGLALAWAARTRSIPAAFGGLLGAALLHRAVSGHCAVYGALGIDTAGGPAEPSHQAIDIARSLTIQAPASEIYRVLSQPDTFARILGHFAELTSAGHVRTQWTLHAPLGQTLRWTTAIAERRPDELLRWSSAEGEALSLNGAFHLRPAPADRGTEVRLQLHFEPPFGALGRALTKLLGPAPSWLAQRALGNLKSLIEAGELPSLHHNPAAR
jgi:uncharacterized membrane protein